jgi:hypothetical protein
MEEETEVATPLVAQGEAPVAPEAAPGPAQADQQYASDLDAALAELQQEEGAPAAPSTPSTWSWENIKKIVKDVDQQSSRGVAEGLNAVDEGAQKIGQWLNDNVVDLGHLEWGTGSEGWGPDNWLTWSPGTYKGDNGGAEAKPAIPDSALPAKPSTAVGQLTNDAAQLGVGLLGAGKFIKVAEGASVLGAMAVRGAQGALADFSVFTANEDNLSDFIQSHPQFANRITEALASDPNDNEAIGRLKQAAEGVIIGTALEGLIWSVKAARAWSKGDKKAALEVLDEVDAASDAAKAEAKAAQPDQLDMFAPEKSAEVSPEQITKQATEAPKEPVQGDLDLGDTPLPKADVETQAVPTRAGQATPVKLVVNQTDEGFKQFIANRDWRNGLFRDEGEDIVGMNTQLIHNMDDVRTTLNALEETYSAEIKAARGGGDDGVVTWQETKALAAQIGDLTGGKPQRILQQLAVTHQNSVRMAAQMKAFGDFFATTAKKVDDLATYVADEFGPLPPGYNSYNDVMADFAKHTELLANVRAMYGGTKTNLARTFNAFKIGAEVNQKTLLHMNPDELFAGGPAAMRAYARRIKAAGGKPKAIGKVTERGLLGNLMAGTQQIWINSILSAPTSHMANIIGSLGHAAYLPAEKMVSGALRAGTKEGRGDFIKGGLEYAGMMMSLKDALKLSVTAFRREAPVLDPGTAGLYTTHNAITQQAYQQYVKPDGTAAWLINTFGKATNLSSRLMMAEDEFIKQMTYRSQVRANAMKEHFMRDPNSTDMHSLAARLTEALDNSVDSTTGQALDKVALEQAQKVTFSNNLQTPTFFGEKSFGEIMQRGVNDHPALRFIMPFVRTPTNIGRFVWSRTPVLNLLRKEELANSLGHNGHKAQADWAARSAIGGTLWGIAGGAAVEGKITGSGPKDPETRRLLEATGWRPYSWKSVDADGKVTYTSYQRLDPFGMFLGMSADLAQAAGHLGDEELSTVAGHMGIALAQQLKSKSYLLGLSQFLDAVTDPERSMDKWMRGQVGSFVPSALKSMNSDPYMREARSVIDEIMRRVPGYSDEVDPVRNIFGEKVLLPPAWGPDSISPLLQGIEPHLMGDQPVTKEWQENVQIDVRDELARQSYIHGKKLMTPPKKVRDVDLTDPELKIGTYTAHDRFSELVGQPDPRKPTLRQALQKVIASPQYQDKLTDGEPGEDGKEGTRIMQINRVIGQYRDAALKALMKENPKVHEAVKMEAYRAAVAKRAKKTPDQQASATDQLLNGITQ